MIDAPLAVVLLVHGEDDAARCIEALLRDLDEHVPLLAGGNAASRDALLRHAGGRTVTWLDTDGPTTWNAAAKFAPEGDLILLSDTTEVGPGWLAGLREVAGTEPDAATVTALGSDAAFLSVPRRNRAWTRPAELTPADAAERIRAGSLGLHPRVPTALPHAALVRRPALQLVGSFDERLSAEDSLADFCARCTSAGLAHVVADEVFVTSRGGRPSPELAAGIEEAATDRHSALARALLATSVVLEPLQVTVDARLLAWGITGSIVHTMELLGALDARKDIRVRALLPDQLGEAGRALDRMPSIEPLRSAELDDAQITRTHVVHRAWQIESIADMEFLDRFGERTVITNQDLIRYRTPTAFGSVEQWGGYRAATREALSLAAMVLFFTETAAADARAEDLVAAYRTRVVPLGARNEHLVLAPEATAPLGLAASDRPFMLVLGNRFTHKNVAFALELLGALRSTHGWDGDLVIAGEDPPHGSSSETDSDWLLQHPQHAAHVQILGQVNEEEKAWLLKEAGAVVYPSTYEGFGLVPFEAAAAGTPCLMAHVSSLRDTVGDDLALLTSWDAAASAQQVIGVLTDPSAGSELVAGIRRAAQSLTWQATGDALVAAYHEAVRLPAPPAARLMGRLAPAEVGRTPLAAVDAGLPRRAVRKLRRRG